ncbi:MAG: AMP-binding protein, partial [Chloroflexi bacterium]|nr:AMP-binding protein [Chloroflexota bacterium]
MDYHEIPKPTLDHLTVKPNLDSLSSLGSGFDWTAMEREVGIRNREEVNLAHLAIDRHAASSRKDKVALFWEGKNGEKETYTFGQLSGLTNRFANVLAGLGIVKGDRVFTFIERVPEAHIAVFGTLKLGAIIGPLFADFGPDPVRDRLKDSGAKVLVTSPALRARIDPILGDLPDLKHIVIVDRSGKHQYAANEVSYSEAMSRASPVFEGIRTGWNDYSIMHYTSGTTGKPKGAVHAHSAAVEHYATGKWVLDFHEDDVYWCTADPGWVTGTSYGMFAPWTNGVSQVFYEGNFWATAWYSVIEKYKVTVWYTAPT